MIYGQRFYAEQQDASRESAHQIVPWLCELVRPQSVVDVGCGVGTWLEAFRQAGVLDTTGIEGPWVSQGKMSSKLITMDLREKITLERRYDLALCLEVAEHLPSDRSQGLVDDLCSLSPVVLFGAALPGQRGTSHINERWASEWIELFQRNRYSTSNLVRRKIWSSDKIAPWYRQNLFLFADKNTMAHIDPLSQNDLDAMIDVVHPEIFAYYQKNFEQPTFRFLGRLLQNACKRCLRR